MIGSVPPRHLDPANKRMMVIARQSDDYLMHAGRQSVKAQFSVVVARIGPSST